MGCPFGCLFIVVFIFCDAAHSIGKNIFSRFKIHMRADGMCSIARNDRKVLLMVAHIEQNEKLMWKSLDERHLESEIVSEYFHISLH